MTVSTIKKSRPTLHTSRGKVVAQGESPSATAPPASPAGTAGRLELIAVAAYYLAQRRNFTPGHDLDDWLAAEREVDAAQPDAGGNAGTG